jgi:hypothetical protein
MGMTTAVPTPPPTQTSAALDQLGGMAEGTADVLDGLAGLERHQLLGAAAHGLDDQADGAGGHVDVGDGERDALGARAEADDDELARLARLGHARSADHQAVDVGGELDVGGDEVHGGSGLGVRALGEFPRRDAAAHLEGSMPITTGRSRKENASEKPTAIHR